MDSGSTAEAPSPSLEGHVKHDDVGSGRTLSRISLRSMPCRSSWRRRVHCPSRLKERPSAKVKGLDYSMDDPLIWGLLPMRFWNKRWSFGSHDICFQGRSVTILLERNLQLDCIGRFPFSSPWDKYCQHIVWLILLLGGLGQPAMTEAIRLLSKGPFTVDHHPAKPELQHFSLRNVCIDPFSDLPIAYTTNGEDAHYAPSAYSCNSYSWVHIFPEGKIHQSPRKTMRYFKWGIARLILETSECPDIVPMWIQGVDDIMHESREFPRFLPRPGKDVSVTFGSKVDTEAVFGETRSRWQKLKAKIEKADPQSRDLPAGVLSESLLTNKEAVELRKEVTLKIRNLVLDVRRSRGLPDEDPKEGLVETWLEEGPNREGHMKDDSWVRDI
ncbi:uncharacterized protein N7469_010461 [Penicillium citrinum]|uniref:Tafazzin family protein n=1 Tax=Penicillium citrinum TaxID=5077 RepID=A0A9W9NMX5_PENCI|nr:uncharacterized protein N7469_010461 [Penicillium citrinum]KAJ5221574.1 hypothetical protein N7469_010461 [Penicillium citrinum]